jgi:hypothetical protein
MFSGTGNKSACDGKPNATQADYVSILTEHPDWEDYFFPIA